MAVRPLLKCFFGFLVLALAALFLRRRRFTKQVLAVAAVVFALTTVEIGVLKLFPASGLVYPFGSWRLLDSDEVRRLRSAAAEASETIEHLEGEGR